MLSALASGTLVRDPKSGTSASGTKWANTTIRANVGQSREGDAETAFITVVCFGDVADRLAKLDKGDAISVQGTIKTTTLRRKAKPGMVWRSSPTASCRRMTSERNAAVAMTAIMASSGRHSAIMAGTNSTTARPSSGVTTN